jgi:8-oxo-dGTP pyrophosphatase MutT (NUDIX family)
MTGDGDGWVHCAMGHRHWGRFGAAGILISDGRRTILQHRAPWTHEGDRWGLPGGARDSYEDPTTTALREALEEAALPAAGIEPIALSVDDHGGWYYTTVLARPATELTPHAANAESTEVRWWPNVEVDGLTLHHGLAAHWPRLRRPVRPIVFIVDSRSDRRFQNAHSGYRDELDGLIRHGIAAPRLPYPSDLRSTSSLLPRVVVVGSEPDPIGDGPDEVGASSTWWSRARTSHVTDDISSAVLELAATDAMSRAVVVVTADRTLRDRVASPAIALDPDWLIGVLSR